jgi:tetratricopeptide (TPR) repeat protein
MTTQTDVRARKSFVSARLPWIVAAIGVVVYLLTLNPWLTPYNLQAYSRATHQEWFTEIYLPVFHLVTSPFRWLPETWVPVALNVFSAVCAAVVLGLLARCVVLLPHDRTQKQREREQNPFGLLSLRTAWIPPILAVVVCGLQLTFWENATNSSSNMLDLVLFAYSIRCLLEYRISRRESWLLRAVVVYAVGMSETWVLLALLPAFVIALVWIKGFEFFQLRSLAALFLCGLGGLLFFLYLPLLHLRTDGAFLGALKANVTTQIQQVVGVIRYAPHPLQLLFVLTSVLPILVIGIRWRSQFGDSSPLGSALTTWIFHLTHAVLLGVCIWAAFDTGFSLRDAQGKFGFNRDHMLPLYFLGSLSIGYLSGYFLLVFRPLPQRGYRTESSSLPRVLSNLSVGVICTVLILVSAGLLYKNFRQIKTTNGPAWRQYAAALTESLPPRAIILSDRSDSLTFARAWLARSGKASDCVFLETHSLRYPAYHRFQSARHRDVWPPLSKAVMRDDFKIGDHELTELLEQLGEKAPLYYLHPSFGGFLETFYAVPHGLVYELQEYPTNTMISPAPMPEAVYTENEDFWKRHEGMFDQLVSFVAPPGPGVKPTFRDLWMQRMHIPFETNATAASLGSIYSRAVNVLGVLDQRLGRLDAAGKHFAKAQEFSPGNRIAAANLDFNRKLRAGERIVAESPGSFEERFGNFSVWEQTLNAEGFFDTATGCLAQGIVFARGRLMRQGAQQFERVLNLAPDNLLARLWLARSYIVWNKPEMAFPLIQELYTHEDLWDNESITPADILRVELAADYLDKKTQEIRPRLEQLSSRNLLDAAVQTCMGFGDFTNALIAIEKRLGSSPDEVLVLLTDGYVRVQLNDAPRAIAPLTHALSIQPTNSDVRLIRGAAYLQTHRVEESILDYQTLLKTDPTKSAAANYGLTECYLLKGDTNNALRCLELSISETPTNAPAAKVLREKLKSLRGGAP